MHDQQGEIPDQMSHIRRHEAPTLPTEQIPTEPRTQAGQKENRRTDGRVREGVERGRRYDSGQSTHLSLIHI